MNEGQIQQCTPCLSIHNPQGKAVRQSFHDGILDLPWCSWEYGVISPRTTSALLDLLKRSNNNKLKYTGVHKRAFILINGECVQKDSYRYIYPVWVDVHPHYKRTFILINAHTHSPWVCTKIVTKVKCPWGFFLSKKWKIWKSLWRSMWRIALAMALTVIHILFA